MASLCLNSFSLSPSSHPKRLTETNSLSSSSSSSSSNGNLATALKPIVVNGSPPTFVSAPARRIIAVGDLHGDLDQARSALEMAGVLSSDGEDLWTGGDSVLVQLGDVLDRGDDEIAILSLLRSLDIQAKAEGGAVFQVNGNHETMNVEGDFRYVEPGAFDECADFLEYLNEYEYDWEEAFAGWCSVSRRWKDERKMSRNNWGPWNLVKVLKFSVLVLVTCITYRVSGQRQKGVISRSVLFRPGGPLACELARHAVVLKVNDWIFCHGGLLPHHVAYGLERMNMEVSQWMRGLIDEDTSPHMPFIATKGYDSVVWNRLYSRDISDLEDFQISQASTLINAILKKTLQAVGAKGMVVGHTPQYSGANCEYNCSIWRIDVGMSSGVLNSRPEDVYQVSGHAVYLVPRAIFLWDVAVDCAVVTVLVAIKLVSLANQPRIVAVEIANLGNVAFQMVPLVMWMRIVAVDLATTLVIPVAVYLVPLASRVGIVAMEVATHQVNVAFYLVHLATLKRNVAVELVNL
ncbi:hypothetical protein COLO4_11148 [Corchorus olitorius]|uniref:Calcineurin-like phosphoesterase domain-containing protein n=1 Tax=Corchorus olitorius TaxID=93759 RepID=A0A1R3K5K4_9ROSI|nr:hypothetical protein COLO4_11148 [Corchorus olitorius]